MELKDLEVYKLAREISREAWPVYKEMDWKEKKLMGDQWIRSIDSIGSNVAEGFGRFHYLDKNKFNYNARGSLTEAIHWTEILHERELLPLEKYSSLEPKLKNMHLKLNNYINSTKERAKNSKKESN